MRPPQPERKPWGPQIMLTSSDVVNKTYTVTSCWDCCYLLFPSSAVVASNITTLLTSTVPVATSPYWFTYFSNQVGFTYFDETLSLKVGWRLETMGGRLECRDDVWMRCCPYLQCRGDLVRRCRGNSNSLILTCLRFAVAFSKFDIEMEMAACDSSLIHGVRDGDRTISRRSVDSWHGMNRPIL